MTMLGLLTPKPSPTGTGDTVYDLAEIRAKATRCVELPSKGLLAVHQDSELRVSFVVFAWYCGPVTRDSQQIDGPTMSIVFHGDRPSGSLRELRHTYWGDDGYLFYPPADVITAAFVALREWFEVP